MSRRNRTAISVSPTAPLLLALFVMLSSPLLLSALLLAAISKQKTALCAVFLFPLFMASWLPLNLAAVQNPGLEGN